MVLKRMLKNQEKIRNISICAHIDHGKTTFADNLLYASGLISRELVGKVRQLDSKPDEVERGITIDSGFIAFPYNDYFFNLVDTPGHVDFGADVISSMRAVDGTICLVCASEGIMPQTETVIRQALSEKVKPLLFINKIDRLIFEDNFLPEEIQNKISKIILDFNSLIESFGEKDFKVGIEEGTVLFGSSIDKWALSYDLMLEKKIRFSDIVSQYDLHKSERDKWFLENCSLHGVVLDSVIKHLPSPVVAQKYRMEALWSGEVKLGENLSSCDSKGELMFLSTKVSFNSEIGGEEGFSVVGRIFSGTLKTNDVVYLSKQKIPVVIKSIKLLDYPMCSEVESVKAGHFVMLSGFRVYTGETISKSQTIPFKDLSFEFKPILTKSIESVGYNDVDKLKAVLEILKFEDPFLKVDLNSTTGEYLISGTGELHLDVLVNRIKTEKNLNVKSSEPLVIYKEEKGILYEPVQTLLFLIPVEDVGSVSKFISSRKGIIKMISDAGIYSKIEVDIAVSNTLGMHTEFMSLVKGRGSISLVNLSYREVPLSRLEDIRKNIDSGTAILR